MANPNYQRRFPMNATPNLSGFTKQTNLKSFVLCRTHLLEPQVTIQSGAQRMLESTHGLVNFQVPLHSTIRLCLSNKLYSKIYCKTYSNVYSNTYSKMYTKYIQLYTNIYNYTQIYTNIYKYRLLLGITLAPHTICGPRDVSQLL